LPGASIGALHDLQRGRRIRSIVAWNQTATDYPARAASIPARSPVRPITSARHDHAVVFGDETFRHREELSIVAPAPLSPTRWCAQASRRRQRSGLHAPRSIAMVVAAFGSDPQGRRRVRPSSQLTRPVNQRFMRLRAPPKVVIATRPHLPDDLALADTQLLRLRSRSRSRSRSHGRRSPISISISETRRRSLPRSDVAPVDAQRRRAGDSTTSETRPKHTEGRVRLNRGVVRLVKEN
jgi:hypothetical protein